MQPVTGEEQSYIQIIQIIQICIPVQLFEQVHYLGNVKLNILCSCNYYDSAYENVGFRLESGDIETSSVFHCSITVAVVS